MSNNNLKVNSKTSLMRLKHQHNKLVDSTLIKVEVFDITAISDEILNLLQCGDIVVKKTGNLRHCYHVSYKEEKHGICISYFDASCVETVSYDFVEGHWAYNSTDITNIGG